MKRKKTRFFAFLIMITVSLVIAPHAISAISASQNILSSGTIALTKSTVANKLIIAYGLLSNQDAQLIGLHFDVADIGFESAAAATTIKTINPRAKAIGYRDIMGMYTYYADWTEVNSHEDWFIHDKYGQRVQNTWGWYLMDPSNQGWRNHLSNFLKTQLDSNSMFDGIFGDDVWGSLPCETLSDQVWNPWTVSNSYISASFGAQWQTNMVTLLSEIKSLIGSKILVINTEDANYAYVNVSDGMLSEGFVHPYWWADSQFPDWKGAVDALSRVSGQGKYYLALGGISIPTNPTQSDLDRVNNMVTYCFASYLLGVNGSGGTFGFNFMSSNDGAKGYYPIFDAPIGYPINQYYQTGAIYKRDFTNGQVLVNPSQTQYYVDLGAQYKTINGQTVTSVTLQANSAVILFR